MGEADAEEPARLREIAPADQVGAACQDVVAAMTPALTELVRDGAACLEALGRAVAAAVFDGTARLHAYLVSIGAVEPLPPARAHRVGSEWVAWRDGGWRRVERVGGAWRWLE